MKNTKLLKITITILLFAGFSFQKAFSQGTENTFITEELVPESVKSAITKVINQTWQEDEEVLLSNPQFQSNFSPSRISISPRGNDMSWTWNLQNINGVEPTPVIPSLREAHNREFVDYHRGNITERYVFHRGNIEQQFIIQEQPASGDLTIEGSIFSEGEFSKKEDHWLWSNEHSSVKLGQLYVYDAQGVEVKASFEVEDNKTRIFIEEEALAAATFPVTIDPEIGPDDFRISFMGPNGNANIDAAKPAVAYNSTDDNYLVVWESDDNTGGLVNDELEVYAQLVQADGSLDSAHVRVSFMGGTGNAAFDGGRADVAYNAAGNNFLVVWRGDSVADNRFAVWGQLIDHLGQPVGDNFQISNTDTDNATDPKVTANSLSDEYCVVWSEIVSSTREITGKIIDATGVEVVDLRRVSSTAAVNSIQANRPALAHNSENNQYLVVWDSEQDDGVLAPGELEIYGQRINHLGDKIGNISRISDMAADGQAQFDALAAEIAYNSQDNEYLVVWLGNDNNGAQREIFGQLLNNSGVEIGQNDFQISDQDFNPTTLDNFPSVSYSAIENRYVVIYDGFDLIADAREVEVYGYFVDADGLDHLSNGFRISEIGPINNPNFTIRGSDITYNSGNGQFLTVWGGEDTGTDGELEIFGQILDIQQPVRQFRISDMGDGGVNGSGAVSASVAYNTVDKEYLVVWQGNESEGGLNFRESEIFAQRLNADGFEIGADFRISDMGPPLGGLFDAIAPKVVYNNTTNEYLVVWSGDDDRGSLVEDEFEIFGQRLTADGSQIGSDDFRISDMGPNGNSDFDAVSPSVIYNSSTNEYLVVWSGDDNTGDLVDEEFEIFGQRLMADGSEVGPNDFRISDMGPDGNTGFDAANPTVAYNTTDNEYLVVWNGVEGSPELFNGEIEIFGQRLIADGSEVGANDFRISDMGPNGNSDFNGALPCVAFNSADNEYLVVWRGDDDTGGLVNDEFEVFGQLLKADGSEVGTNDFLISNMGPTGSPTFDALITSVVYNSVDNNYLVVWEGDDNTDNLVNDEFEIFGQFISSTGRNIGTNDFRITETGPNGSAAFDALNPVVVFNPSRNNFLVIFEAEHNILNLVENEFEIYGEIVEFPQPLEDFRISDMGPNGNDDFGANNPSVAYNSLDNEYLVVWHGDDITGDLVNDEFEIFGQLMTADGFEIGGDFRISDMGPDGESDFDAFDPSVAYNSIDNEYLVVWRGDDNTGDLVNNENEIFGQRLMADGSEVGTNDFRISDMGPDGQSAFNAREKSVVYNRIDNEYLVVWRGDDNTGDLVNNEDEIFGQRLMADGSEIGNNDFRISDMGPNGENDFAAFDPTVAFNTTANEYLVVWSGDDDTGDLVDDESEIFGQRLMADGSEIGTNDFRISDMGPNGGVNFLAARPSVAYNTAFNEYLVVWEGDDHLNGLANDEFEIFGQRLMADGSEIGTNDFRISDMGPEGNQIFGAFNPSVTYNMLNNNYLVVWHGEDTTGNLIDEEFEIYGQFISSTGRDIGTNDFRISDMGPDGDNSFDAFDPVVTFNPSNNSFLVVWEGDDNTGSLVNGENEIFGELIDASGLFPCLLTLDDTQIGAQIATGVYQARDVISSSGLIPVGNDVLFDAGVAIDLLPDFEVELGALLEILLDGCNEVNE